MNPTILVIDDDAVDWKMIKKYLIKKEGRLNIIRAKDGEEGLEILQNRYLECDFIVILDLNMPRMSGFELLQFMRQDENLSRIIVFIMSSSDCDFDRSRTYGQSISGYFLKDPNLLAQNISAITCFAEAVRFPPRVCVSAK